MATAAEIQQQITGLQNRYRIAQNGLATLNRNLQSNQVIIARYTAEVSTIPGQVQALEAQLNSIQSTPGAGAGQTVNDDATNNPNKPPPLQAGPDGRVTTPPATTTPTNASQPDVGVASTGVDQPTKTFNTTQATYEGVSGQAMPVPPVSTGGTTLNNTTTANNNSNNNNTITNTVNPNSDPNTNIGSEALGSPTGAPVTPTTAGNGEVDDNIPPRPENQSVKVNNGFNDPQPISPQPNILAKFASSTYNASVYLMTPAQYQALIQSKQKKVNGYNLLFQSGGAPTNVGGAKGALSSASTNNLNAGDPSPGVDTSSAIATPGAKDPDAGRNPFFADDFYIESITVDNHFPGKMTGAAHMVTNMKFTVIEPGGITLIDRLYQAVQDQAPKDATGAVNYTAAQYLMVIRWYGYDEAGNLIRPGAKGKDGLSDPNAICEKFIPFIIKKINWGVSNKLVSYDFECGPVGQLIAGTTARGTVPYDIELSDSTVSGLLGGSAKYGTGATTTSNPGASTTTAPAGNQSNTNQSDAETARLTRQNAAAAGGRNANDPRRTDSATGGLNSVTGVALPSPAKASAAPTPKKTITAGLMGAMNELQAELVSKGIYQHPDTYEIVFTNGAEAIRDALITLPGKVKNQSSTPMAPAAAKDPKSKDTARQRTDNNVRNFNITAGQQILQAIDLTIRNSSYIYKQAAVQNSETPNIEKIEKDGEDNNSSENKVPATANLNWFEITMEAIPGKYDYNRNDYSYTIRYIISPYIIQNFNSKFYPIPKFLGIHKQYRYWFTGENTDVIDYQATFNHLYNMTVSGREPGNNNLKKLRQKYTSSMQELTKYSYQAASDQTRSGAESDANEVSANAAESLYSPSDLAKGKIKIVGDPGWMQQGSVSSGVGISNFNYSGFLPDGTINFDSQQVMFAIEWQRPQDYNLNTGLANPYGREGGARKPVNSYVYQAIKCTSEFRQGRFEQTIDGSLYYYPVENLKNAATQPSNGVANDGSNSRSEDTTSTKSTGGKTMAEIEAEVNNSNTASASITSTTPNDDSSPGPQQNSSTSSDGQDIGLNAFLAPPKMGVDQNFIDANAEPQTDDTVQTIWKDF